MIHTSLLIMYYLSFLIHTKIEKVIALLHCRAISLEKLIQYLYNKSLFIIEIYYYFNSRCKEVTLVYECRYVGY